MHMTGRAQLRTHNGTQGGRLQSTGFLAVHENEKWNQPIEGPEVPRSFGLNRSGTGVYILGFDQAEHPKWEDEILEAALSQFFPAVRWGNLVVRAGNHTLDRHTLREQIDNLDEKDPTRHYFLALDAEPIKLRKEKPNLPGIGMTVNLDLRISTNTQAPRKLAHINRRGMLITVSRERGDNPLYPRGAGSWSPWSAVTVAADEESEKNLRRMEPPAHNALHTKQMGSRQEQDAAQAETRRLQEEIRENIRKVLDETNQRNSTNVEELAKLFPLSGKSQGRDLDFHVEPMKLNNDQTVEFEETGKESGGDDKGPQDGSGDRPGESGGKGKSGGSGNKPASAVLHNVRIIRNSARNLIMAFTTPKDQREIKFSLRAAGEQYQRNETPIEVQQVVETGDITASARMDGNTILVEAPPNTRVNLMISLTEEDREYNSYRLVLTREEE